MVPSPSNPQSLNRFSYTRNNPLKYIDPSGHRETEGCDYEGCSATQYDKDRAIGNAERAKSTKFYRDCTQGGGTGCPNLGEMAMFAFDAVSLASGKFVVNGLLGILGYTVGNGINNAIQGKGAVEGWNVTDAMMAYSFTGATGGMVKPALKTLGLNIPGFVVSGLMSGAQYVTKQTLYNDGNIDSGNLAAQIGMSAAGSFVGESVFGTSSSFGSQLGRAVVGSATKGMVLGIINRSAKWMAEAIDQALVLNSHTWRPFVQWTPGEFASFPPP
jgi:hypothetical protein